MYLEAILKSQDSLQSNKSIFHSQGGILCFRAFVGKKLKVPEKFLAMIYVRRTIHSITKIWVPPSTSPLGGVLTLVMAWNWALPIT